MARPVRPSRRGSATRTPAWRGWRLAALVVGLLALGATAACAGGGATWHEPGTPVTDSGGGAEAVLTLVPGTDAKDISPADPVTATIAGGTLDTVTLTNSTGKVVAGAFNADKSSWSSSEALGYNKRYTLAVKGTGADGKPVEQTRSFTTVKPGNLTYPYLRANVGTLLDKGTFGVGQPVVVWFDESIKDRAAAERALSVTTDPPGIVGGWYWMDDHEVHWRPKEYWPSGTKVTVDAKVYGRDLGGGLYGQQDTTATFTIGHSKIAVADGRTHRMKVYIDGKQVKKINGHDVTLGIPISMGKGGTETTKEGVKVDFTTNSGVHVVTLKYDVYRMTSASFGIIDPKDPNFYDTNIEKAIRITGDGEFVHNAPWSVWAQGNTNVSHGCINVGPTYIFWFFDQFGAGDIVNVTGTSRHLDKRNGLGDWVVPWDEWLKGSALT